MYNARLWVDRLSQACYLLCLWSSAWGKIPTVKIYSQSEGLRLRSVEALVCRIGRCDRGETQVLIIDSLRWIRLREYTTY
jgi:hypothetical protein